MKVLDLIRKNENWEEILAGEPYYIKVVRDGNYVLLKYNQLASDFTNEIVRECRGCVFWIPENHREFTDVVCFPFEKFGNYGESYVPSIHWDSARVLEKIDGSLMKCWWHNGNWHISTNSTIDARKAGTRVEGVSFYDVFMGALEKNGNPHDFFSSLDQDYTYMFELVSLETRVTIEYPEAAIYYLGARNMLHFNEVNYPTTTIDFKFFPFVKLPMRYPISTLEECIEAVNLMGANEEGFVVCDKFFNRMKIKSPEYLIASRIRNNNAITVKRVVEAMRAGYLDDFYAYAPDYRGFVDSILEAYNRIAKACEMWYIDVFSYMRHNKNKKLHEVISNGVPKAFQDYCYKRFNNQVKDAYEYLDNQTLGHLVDWVKTFLGQN